MHFGAKPDVVDKKEEQDTNRLLGAKEGGGTIRKTNESPQGGVVTGGKGKVSVPPQPPLTWKPSLGQESTKQKGKKKREELKEIKKVRNATNQLQKSNITPKP